MPTHLGTASVFCYDQRRRWCTSRHESAGHMPAGGRAARGRGLQEDKQSMDGSPPTTSQKALAINLDARTYGTFAEIGGGQEVSRWFFAVGGAAGTVAKSISAYDMAVSDGLYGPAKRYVSRQRLE